MNSIRILFALVTALTAMPAINLLGQASAEKEKELVSKAHSLYIAEDYAGAGKIYSGLLSNHPDNSSWNYFYGVCVLKSTNKRTEAIPYLLKAAKAGDVPSMVHYYLAKAYQEERNFAEAIREYEQVKKNESRIFLNEYKIDMQMNMCQRAMEIDFAEADKLILSTAQENENEFYLNENFYKTKGRFLAILDRFTKGKTKDKFSKYIFVDGAGKWMVYSGPGKSGISEVFLARRKSHDSWEEPSAIKFEQGINFNKYNPTIADNGSTIYFSTDELGSVGGMDIFKTTYSFKSKTWSAPEQMDEPVNSPSDDFYYLPLPEGQKAVFCSNRNSPAGKIGVYAVNTNKPVRIVQPTVPQVVAVNEKKLFDENKMPPAVQHENSVDSGNNENLNNEVVITEAIPSYPANSGSTTQVSNSEKKSSISNSEPSQKTIAAIPDNPNVKPETLNGEVSLAIARLPRDIESSTKSSPITLKGFFYPIDEPKNMNAIIRAEKTNGNLISVESGTNPQSGEYSLQLPSGGNYTLKVEKEGVPVLETPVQFNADGAAEICRQIITYKDSSENRQLSIIGCENGQNKNSAINYAVQIGAFKQKPAEEVIAAFSKKGIIEITHLMKNDFRVFVTGLNADFYAALKKRKELLELGINDAFIVAISDNRFIPLEDALTASR